MNALNQGSDKACHPLILKRLVCDAKKEGECLVSCVVRWTNHFQKDSSWTELQTIQFVYMQLSLFMEKNYHKIHTYFDSLIEMFSRTELEYMTQQSIAMAELSEDWIAKFKGTQRFKKSEYSKKIMALRNEFTTYYISRWKKVISI